MLPALHPRQVGGQVVADVLAQAGNGLAYGLRTAVLLTGEEQELRTVGGDHVEKDAHRGVGDATQFEFVLAHQADGLAKGSVDLGNQGQAQGVHVGKMPVEAGGYDAGRLRHFAQADTAETTATLHEQASCIEQGLAGL
ncbi:hypothetical protein D3C77_608970 [compost metagenome]